MNEGVDEKLSLDGKVLAKCLCVDGGKNISVSERSLCLTNENNDLRKEEAMCNFQWAQS